MSGGAGGTAWESPVPGLQAYNLGSGGDARDLNLSRCKSGTSKAFPDPCSLPIAFQGLRLQAWEANLVSHILTLYSINHVFYFLCF